MKEYTLTLNLVFQTMIATEANSKEEAIEEIREHLNDYKVWFDDELFDFDDIEVLTVGESE